MSEQILIVEDEKSQRKVLEEYVRGLGYEVVTAQNGVEALEKFKTLEPQLLLMDIVMPEKNGFDVLEEIRLKLKKKTPVVILSNLEQKEDVETATNLGVTQYLLKSNLSLRKLGTIIHQTLQDH